MLVHRPILLALLTLVVFVLPALRAHPQDSQIPSASQGGMTRPDRDRDRDNGISPDIQKQMQKKANEQRQADLKRDTERLLKLSTELKQYVDKSNENMLSLDVIKKAEEIEKLAHSVKMKMRGDQ